MALNVTLSMSKAPSMSSNVSKVIPEFMMALLGIDWSVGRKGEL